MTQLASRTCSPQQGNALDGRAAKGLLAQLDGWSMDDGAKAVHRTFNFQSYFATMAFANAVAWIAHREDHHPDMAVGYNTLTVTFSTHSVGGLTENDFICAAKVDALGTL